MNFESLIGTGATVLALIAIFFVLMSIVTRYYKKISPNVVAVVSGRNHTLPDGSKRGYRVISGGGFLLVPVVEKMEEMSLNVRTVGVNVSNVPDKNGALVSVRAIANVKILSSAESLPLAIERFLGKEIGEIDETTQQTLEGNLRAIVGTMSIEELIKDRQAFQQSVLNEAGTDLAKLGLGVDVLKVQEVKDERGYIESLGKRQTAQVVRDASVGEAEMHRDTAVKTATARQEGEIATAQAERAISDANCDLGMQVADNAAKVKAQEAQIPIAAEIAAANRTKELNTAKVEAEKATITAGIALQEEERKRNEAQLNATVIVTAEKNREALVIAADAKLQAAEKDGEAARILQEKQGLGQKAQDVGTAEGRKAIASAVQAEKEADAAGEKAQLLARAAGKEADLLAAAAGTKAEKLAVAEGLRQYLLAEAEGALKKAEAFKALDEGGRFLMILNALPPIIEALGVAAEKALTPTAEAIGDGLANVKELRIIDMGGSGAGATGGKNVLGQFVNLPVETIYGLVNKLKASGMMPMVEQLAAKYGVDLNKVLAGVPDVTTNATTVASVNADGIAADSK